METPVLFIIFNRKEIALRTLQEIRKAKPSKLYIAGDGPRLSKTGESEVVNETRQAIIDSIDWNCIVKTQFQDENLGCGPGVYSAINWFFENEEEGIILEDDCVPLPGFFKFSTELLLKYRIDERIAGITGFNPLRKQVVDNSYCFSKYMENWGWATWRRAWQRMDIGMNWLGTSQEGDIISNAGYFGKDVENWRHGISLIHSEKISAWDVQWSFTVAAQNQLTIYPKYNLISNIGVGEQATHTGELSPLLNFKVEKDLEFPLNHPNYVVPNLQFDKAIYQQRNHLLARLARYFPENIKRTAKKALGKVIN